MNPIDFGGERSKVKVTMDIYLSKVLTERFSILNKIQTKKDKRLYILTLILIDMFMPQIKSFMQCSNTYMYTTHVIIQIESILKYWKGFLIN